MDPLIQKRVDDWLQGPFDEKTKAAILQMQQNDPKGLIDAFYTDLSFGTGGLRGLMGPGTNRMNIYTVRKATQGLANYLLKEIKDKPIKVLIGFDSRHHSASFAHETAQVFAANGIEVYLLKELRPTPYISFACRYKKCHAAVMITASHNPAEYNGYKVYWTDGAQVVAPHDKGIMKEVEAIANFDEVKTLSQDSPLVHIVDQKLDSHYLAAVRGLQTYPEQNKTKGDTLKIAFTSLHGTGITIAPDALADWGFTDISYVREQVIPDGNFPTVQFPNPEYKETLALGIKNLEHSESDILLATDPDADRLGIVVQHHGKPIILNGNETASICVEYLCEGLTAQKKMPPKSAIVTTIVSTDLLRAIAQKYKIACFEVLTGFKYIGEKIHQWEQMSDGYHFLFGAEESYGYLIGTHARDKDAIVSCCLLSEIALAAKIQGKTLIDKLYDIYQSYGVFREKQRSIDFALGKEGMDKMKSLMANTRKNSPSSFLDKKVIQKEDYLSGIKTDLLSGKEEKLTLPTSDVLLFRLEDGSKVVIRPSGTEPKLKIYAGVCQKDMSSVEEGIKQCDAKLDELLEAAVKDLQR